MDPENINSLLKDESFINFCTEKNDNDVRFWLKHIEDHPDDRYFINELKALVITSGIEASRQEAQTQFDKLQKLISRQPFSRKKKLIYFNPWALTAAMAAIVLVFLAFGVFYLKYKTPKSNYVFNRSHDISPGGNRALLTLANGRKLDITHAKPGLLVDEPGFRVRKTADGQLVYQVSERKDNDANLGKLNTIEIPAKGQFMIVLPDGTRVWLNAKTTLIYPAVFDQAVRKVELNGEGYFEVAHRINPITGKRLPFIVKYSIDQDKNLDQEIEVLGTHFNVNCYANEPAAVTTLLEGSVKVRKAAANRSSGALLRPNQEVVSSKTIFQVRNADIEAAIAWKNGDFVFREDIHSALRKVARWYDVDIIYMQDAPQDLALGGWISRKNNISEVLNMMESTGKIHFKLDGRRVLVSK
ncbi:FecR domain-containing protein [Mucilaginibacter sp. PAMB04274]|uniref:FecR family protein n=1 Tax=Mucilaginibacter sp. PAMB04274 TaxID=3138568 RepID=UPI0031F64EC0